MQNVLCIDISNEPAQVVVVSLNGPTMQVLEQHNAFLGDALSRASMLSETDTPSEAQPSEEDTEATDTPPPPPVSTNGNHSPLKDLVSSVKAEWTEAVLIVPPYDYLSLNLELPFADARSINKIIDLEVQDLVPFEIEDFLVSHKTTAPLMKENANPRFDVHVGIIPRQYMRNIMSLCKKAGFEPMVVTTPTSVLATPYHLAPDFFVENSALVYESDPEYFLITCFDGQLRAARSLSRMDHIYSANGSSSAPSGSEDSYNSILTDLKLALSAAERRYKKNFDKIYYVGSGPNPNTLQQVLGRPIERISLNEFVEMDDKRGNLAALSSVLVRDQLPAPVLSNFRVREFSYSPQLKELFRGLRGVAPYLLALLGCFVVYLLLGYLLDSYKIYRLRSAMETQLQQLMPGTSVTYGGELEAMQIEVNKLRDQLKDVAPLSALSPLDLLAEVARLVPTASGIQVKSVKIRDNKITINGSAQEYGNIEELAKVLKKSQLFKRVKRGESSGPVGVGGTRSFTYEVFTDES